MAEGFSMHFYHTINLIFFFYTEEVVNVIVEGGAVPALVRHLREPLLAPNEGEERPFEHEVEKGSAFALGLLAVKVTSGCF